MRIYGVIFCVAFVIFFQQTQRWATHRDSVVLGETGSRFSRPGRGGELERKKGKKERRGELKGKKQRDGDAFIYKLISSFENSSFAAYHGGGLRSHSGCDETAHYFGV